MAAKKKIAPRVVPGKSTRRTGTADRSDPFRSTLSAAEKKAVSAELKLVIRDAKPTSRQRFIDIIGDTFGGSGLQDKLNKKYGYANTNRQVDSIANNLWSQMNKNKKK